MSETKPAFILDAFNQPVYPGDRVAYAPNRSYKTGPALMDRVVGEIVSDNYLRLAPVNHPRLRPELPLTGVKTNRWRIVKLPPK